MRYLGIAGKNRWCNRFHQQCFCACTGHFPDAGFRLTMKAVAATQARVSAPEDVRVACFRQLFLRCAGHSSPSESDSIISVGLSSLCGMFSEARSILWQGQGSFSLFESSKNLFQDRCELFGVGFHRSCGGEFFPSFLESLRTIAAHSGLLPAEREGIVP